jgi:hypothetical protein
MQTPPAAPDFHFLLFAPGLETWIFRAARRYWDAYRPTMYSMGAPDDVELVTYAQGQRRQVAVTLIMRRDNAPAVRAAVGEILTDVYLDPLVYDSPTDLQITLNARVEFDQRFGIPDDASATPDATRTPGPINLP